MRALDCFGSKRNQELIYAGLRHQERCTYVSFTQSMLAAPSLSTLRTACSDGLFRRMAALIACTALTLLVVRLIDADTRWTQALESAEHDMRSAALAIDQRLSEVGAYESDDPAEQVKFYKIESMLWDLSAANASFMSLRVFTDEGRVLASAGNAPGQVPQAVRSAPWPGAEGARTRYEYAGLWSANKPHWTPADSVVVFVRSGAGGRMHTIEVHASMMRATNAWQADTRGAFTWVLGLASLVAALMYLLFRGPLAGLARAERAIARLADGRLSVEPHLARGHVQRVDQLNDRIDQVARVLLDERRALAEQAGFLHEVIEHSPNAVFAIDGAGTVRRANRRARERFDLVAGQAAPHDFERTLAQILSLPDGMREEALALPCKQSAEAEQRAVFRVVHTSVLDQGERMTLWRAIDVTALSDRLAFVRMVIEHAPLLIAVRSLSGEILVQNAAHRTFFETARGLDTQAAATSNTQAVDLDLTFARDDGATVHLHLVRRVISAPGGESWLIECFTDVSERVRMLMRVESAQVRAEQASAAKNSFINRLAHDVRTPLSAIQGLGDLIRKGALNTEQRLYLQAQADAVDSLFGLLNEALDLQRIEAGQMVLAIERISVSRLMQRVLRPHWQRALAKGVRFELAIAPEVPEWLQADPLRLEEVITNLLSNAIKFTERGTVRVALDWVKELNAAPHLRLTVSDTGRDMHPDEQSRVFAPFTQASDQIAPMYGGSGLGLSIVEGLVRVMEGRIELTSEFGAGTSITVDLPLNVAEDVQPKRAFAPHTVVLVCSEPSLANYLCRSASRSGLSAVQVSDLDDAAEHLRRGKGDCVVVDHAFWSSAPSRVRNLRAEFADITVAVHLQPGQSLGDSVREFADDSEEPDAVLLSPLSLSDWDGLGARRTSGGTMSEHGLSLASGRTNGPAGPDVVVVEDNDVVQLVIQGILAPRGWRVLPFLEATPAMCHLQEQSDPPALILLDLNLPGVSGLEFARHWRAVEATRGYRRTPIVCISAQDQPEDREVAVAAGVDAFLPKPFGMAMGEFVERYRPSHARESDPAVAADQT
ncbi:hypothetical protein IP84_08790 [beta proteobacterium AAP99]|nr:hypothetical protein IP84_08790 [beta proteobacterium AAP99]